MQPHGGRVAVARALAALLALWPALAAAQADPQTLADIRGEIAALAADIGGLRAELVASGAAAQGAAGNTPLERLDSIEGQLQQLTSKTEELEFRINRITVDGTNRLGDLEFRVCEVTDGCDVSLLGDTPSLGGVDSASVVPVPEEPTAAVEPPTGADSGADSGAASGGAGGELAVNEQADFERAQGALASGDFQGAADGLAAFVEAYPGSPLTARAQLGLGQARDGLGQAQDAARAYLDSFSADPAGDFAADALLGLGRNLGRIGQVPDACITLGEVEARFPASPLVPDAQAERRALACP